MTAKPALGIRAQIALLAVVPLGFLVLTLVLLMLLVRIGQQSSLVVQRVTRVVGQSDLMTQTVGRMSNDLSLYAKSGKRKGLPDYVTAKALLERQRGEMQALVRDDPVLAPAAARYVKGNAAVARPLRRRAARVPNRWPPGRRPDHRGTFDEGARRRT